MSIKRCLGPEGSPSIVDHSHFLELLKLGRSAAGPRLRAGGVGAQSRRDAGALGEHEADVHSHAEVEEDRRDVEEPVQQGRRLVEARFLHGLRKELAIMRELEHSTIQ